MTPTVNPILETLEPVEVFSKFHLLTAIPRGSGNEEGVSDFLRDWAKSKGFGVEQDDAHNLLITKPGANAAEDVPPVILQAHLDMVCVAASGHDFDFTKQPIKVFIDDSDKDNPMLRADKTTLGADDGIGVAFALAMLDSDGPHPPLEVVLTTEEETGMDGAHAFDVSQLKGSRFINIDAEEEGLFYVSCAGGVRLDITLPTDTVSTSSLPNAKDLAGLTIQVGGLKGGHSGAEIDKERGNSHRLMARILHTLTAQYQIALHDIHGGVADNAIPAFTQMTVTAPKEKVDAIRRDLSTWQDTFRNELKASDGKSGDGEVAHYVTVELEEGAAPEWVLSQESFDKLLLALIAIPTGVAAMDLAQPNQILPESSSNLAIVKLHKDHAAIRISVRSQLASKKQFVREQIETIARYLGGTIEAEGDYPGWAFDPDSKLRPRMIEVYETLTKKKAKAEGVHAGLECGLFSEHAIKAGKKLDCVSMGPDMHEVHTPMECLNIPSTARTWKFFKELMADLAKK